MDKIKILLIDDNPTSLMENEGKGSFIPSFDYGYSDTKFPENSISSNFELGWLQSPRDVREFRSFSEEIIQKFGHTALLSEGFIPEIVLFDYKLSEGLNKYIDYDLEEEYKSIIPTYKLSKKIGENPHRFFDWNKLNTEMENIKNEIAEEAPSIPENEKIKLAKVALKKADYERLRSNEPAIFFKSKDDMGCFSGGLIAFQFKDYPCVGIPITSKDGEMDVSEDALYFEWLLSKDFDDQFGKKYGKKPFWNEVIPQAVLLLRNRIELLVKLGKITPSYLQLIQLSEGNTTEGIFSFTSAYGERHLPLDGLFIDEPEATRIQKIKTWAETLIGALPMNYKDIDTARKVSDILWNTYINRFEDRILLSDYTLRKGKLNAAEERTFEDLKRKYCDGTESITKDKEVSIDTLLSSKEKPTTKRLAVLLTVARAWIQLEICKQYALPKEEYAQIQKEEYIYMLFPMDNTLENLLLPMHKEKGKEKGKLMQKFHKAIFRSLSLPESPVTERTWDQFEKWTTAGEKRLLYSVYFAKKEFLPNWLKQWT